MILEVRTYTAHPGKAAQWLEYYEKHGLPVQQKHLGGLVGFFTCEIGTLNRIVHLNGVYHRADARDDITVINRRQVCLRQAELLCASH